MFKFKDFEAEFDICDVETNERFIEAMELIEDMGTPPVRTQCEIVAEAIDIIFGEGTSEKIFDKKLNYREHIECITKLVDLATEQSQAINKKTEKYKPNRAERRQK